jgi:hypothetical protein
MPPASAGFVSMRVPLRDSDTEDISFHFPRVCAAAKHALGRPGLPRAARAGP